MIKNIKKLSAVLLTFLVCTSVFSQEVPSDSTIVGDDFNFDELGNADDFTVKTFCSQKVPGLTPTQFISIGYEGQAGFPITIAANGRTTTTDVKGFGGVRFAFNAPVISRSNFILNLGLTYWNTNLSLQNPNLSELSPSLENGLRSTGINATVFKPLNDKHFLIFQVSSDVNGNYRSFEDLELDKTTTYSALGIFGWKKDENTMFGVGLTRTYRAGQVLHIPAIYYNKTFNSKWGLESVVPARINLRRNFGTTGLLLLGYEIEGNTYYLNDLKVNNGDVFLRRGELKPRINYQRQLAGFVWVSAQAGLRYNWRFNGFSSQNPTGENMPIFDNQLGNPLYFNISLNLVSP